MGQVDVVVIWADDLRRTCVSDDRSHRVVHGVDDRYRTVVAGDIDPRPVGAHHRSLRLDIDRNTRDDAMRAIDHVDRLRRCRIDVIAVGAYHDVACMAAERDCRHDVTFASTRLCCVDRPQVGAGWALQ